MTRILVSGVNVSGKHSSWDGYRKMIQAELLTEMPQEMCILAMPTTGEQTALLLSQLVVITVADAHKAYQIFHVLSHISQSLLHLTVHHVTRFDQYSE